MSDDLKNVDTVEEKDKSEKKKPGPKPKQPLEVESNKEMKKKPYVPSEINPVDSEELKVSSISASGATNDSVPSKEETKSHKREPTTTSAIPKNADAAKSKDDSEIILHFDYPVYLYSHPNVAKTVAKTSGKFILKRRVNDMFVEVIAKLPGNRPGKYFIRSSIVSPFTLAKLK